MKKTEAELYSPISSNQNVRTPIYYSVEATGDLKSAKLPLYCPVFQAVLYLVL